jgi:hypothetical protein
VTNVGGLSLKGLGGTLLALAGRFFKSIDTSETATLDMVELIRISKSCMCHGGFPLLK